MTTCFSSTPSAFASTGSASDCHWLPVWICQTPSLRKASAFSGSSWKCSTLAVLYVASSVWAAPLNAASTPSSLTTSAPSSPVSICLAPKANTSSSDTSAVSSDFQVTSTSEAARNALYVLSAKTSTQPGTVLLGSSSTRWPA